MLFTSLHNQKKKNNRHHDNSNARMFGLHKSNDCCRFCVAVVIIRFSVNCVGRWKNYQEVIYLINCPQINLILNKCLERMLDKNYANGHTVDTIISRQEETDFISAVKGICYKVMVAIPWLFCLYSSSFSLLLLLFCRYCCKWQGSADWMSFSPFFL